MENNRATAYKPAKKRIGCREPMGVKVLDFIRTRVFGFSKWVAGGWLFLPLSGIDRIKILAILVVCKSTSTQLNNGQKTTGQEKNYY
jgi:hypothetical protein